MQGKTGSFFMFMNNKFLVQCAPRRAKVYPSPRPGFKPEQTMGHYTTTLIYVNHDY